MAISRHIPFVKVGDPFRAADHNKLIQQVRDNGQHAAPGRTAPNQNRTVLMCQNISGEDYEVGEPVSWKDTLTVTDVDEFNPREPFADYLIESERIVWHENIAHLGVVLNDTPDGDFGRICIAGLAVLKLAGTGTVPDGEWATPDPDDPKQWKLSPDAGMARVIDKINDEYAIAQMGVSQPRWIYELTEDSKAPLVTTAKLLHYDLTDYSTTEIELSDPLSAGVNDTDGYRGYCWQSGNEFHIGLGPCV